MPDSPLAKTNKYDNGGITHTMETGEDAILVHSETVHKTSKIVQGNVSVKQLPYSLAELTKTFHMFTLAPIYLMCLWDMKRMAPKLNIIYQFGLELRMKQVPDVISYRAPVPLLRGDAEDWDTTLEGLPLSYQYLFRKFVEQMVFVNRDAKPVQYFRAYYTTVQMQTPGALMDSGPVDIWLPTGVDYKIGLVPQPDGSYAYSQHPPEDWVREEAMRYFVAS